MLGEAISKALKKTVHHPELFKVMEYAVFPTGKLFRARLVEALALDLNQSMTQDHLHLASAIEIHHAYTLVHDDLPSMDNDLIRRGKAATHARFGEWQAVLAGDALLIASFSELQNIRHKCLREINQLMLWCTGAKGLIEGQFRDLSAGGKITFSEIVRIHELKTGRLIQLACLGSYLLSPHTILRGKINFLRLGREIGVSFQLFDDLSELTSEKTSDHEKEINPFITSPQSALRELKLSHLRLTDITFKFHLDHTIKILQDYFEANKENLLKNFHVIEKNIGKNCDDLKNWITNFV